MTDGFRDSGAVTAVLSAIWEGYCASTTSFYDDAFEGIRYYMPPEDVSDHKAVVAELPVQVADAIVTLPSCLFPGSAGLLCLGTPHFFISLRP